MNYVFKTSGFYPVTTYSCPDIHSMIGLIQSDIGIGFLSSRVAAEYAHSPIVSVSFRPLFQTMTAAIYLSKLPVECFQSLESG